MSEKKNWLFSAIRKLPCLIGLHKMKVVRGWYFASNGKTMPQMRMDAYLGKECVNCGKKSKDHHDR